MFIVYVTHENVCCVNQTWGQIVVFEIESI